MIAIFRGWIIQSTNNDRVNGKTFDLNNELPELAVAFEMEQTGDIHIELMSVDGESIACAKVATWPNKVNLTGGATTLTSEWRSALRDWIRWKRSQVPSEAWRNRGTPAHPTKTSDNEVRPITQEKTFSK